MSYSHHSPLTAPPTSNCKALQLEKNLAQLTLLLTSCAFCLSRRRISHTEDPFCFCFCTCYVFWALSTWVLDFIAIDWSARCTTGWYWRIRWCVFYIFAVREMCGQIQVEWLIRTTEMFDRMSDDIPLQNRIKIELWNVFALHFSPFIKCPGSVKNWNAMACWWAARYQ